MKQEQVTPKNAGTPAYEEVLRRIEKRGECPFCLANLLKEHSEEPLKMGNHWYLIRNLFSYEKAKQRFVLVSLKHIENLSGLSQEAMEEVLEFFRFIQEKFGVSYGGLAMRFGDPSKTGATVNHLHFHLIEPHDPATLGYEPIRFRIGGRT